MENKIDTKVKISIDFMHLQINFIHFYQFYTLKINFIHFKI